MGRNLPLSHNGSHQRTTVASVRYGSTASFPMALGSSHDLFGVDHSGQRRYLTVLFSDLTDSTFLSGLLEAEHYAQMLGELRACFREVVAKHGGHIARIQGDGVLAIFGFPHAGEDDGRRATEAALEMHAAAGRIVIEGSYVSAGPLTLHSGIHAGLVFLAEGDVERGRFELLGSVPNMAARLGNLAQRGEICVSEETLGADAHFFKTTGPHLVDLDLAAGPLMVYQVLGHALVHSRFEARAMRGLAPFVGREAAIHWLETRLRDAVAGVPHCIALSGGAGLGKTRLIEEFIKDAADGRILLLRGYCESYLSAEPLQPFMQMLRGVFDLRPGMSAEEANAAAITAWSRHGRHDDPRAQPALSLVGLGGSAAESMPVVPIAAICGVIDMLAESKPLLVIVDDWQWADDASQEVFAAIRQLQRPILLIKSMRSSRGEPLPVAAIETLELSPLALEEAAITMERLLPGADPFMVAEIHRYAGGNPLFIEELCHAATADGRTQRPERRAGGAWLNALIESRVARLPAAQAEIVRVASVLGNVFPAWLLHSITGHGEDAPLVKALAEQDFIFPSEQAGILRFKHGIARDVVYDAVGLHQRKKIHLHAAAILRRLGDQGTAEDVSEALAYHYGAGDEHANAAHYAELAGDKAMTALALDRARAQYLAALHSLDSLSPLTRAQQLKWCAVAQKVGLVCVYDPLTLDDGVELFERGVKLSRQSEDLETIARSEYWLGYSCYAKGKTRKAIGHCEEALRIATDVGDTRLAAQVTATLGQALVAACEYGRASGLLDGAIETKRKHGKAGSGVAVGSAYTLSCKGFMLGDQGRFALAEECFAEALALLGDSPHQVGCSVRGWISTVYQWQGRWDDALKVSEQAANIAEHVRSRHLLAMSRALSGYSRWMLTRQPHALESIRTSTAWIEARNGSFFMSLIYGWLVDGAIASGQTEDIRRHAARLFMRARHSDRAGEAMGCRALARLSAQVGDFERADRYLSRADQSARLRNSSHETASTQMCRAHVEAMRGRSRQAIALVDEASGAFERIGMPWHLSQAAQLRAGL